MSNKSLLKVFSSLFMIFLSTITLVFAWYAINKEATATGINAVVAENNATNGKIKRYIAENYDTGTVNYLIGDDLDTLTDITKVQYSDLGYNKVIYELSATINSTSYSLTLANTDSSRTSYIFETTDSDSNTIYANYLSNVAKFTLLKRSLQGGQYVYSTTTFSDSEASKSLTYSGKDGTSQINTVTLEEGSTTSGSIVTLYLLFDYDSDRINQIYSDNIGRTGGDGDIYFKEDLEFRFA